MLPTSMKLLRQAHRSVRCKTTMSSSVANLLRWCWPRLSSSRATRPHSCESNTTARSTSRIWRWHASRRTCPGDGRSSRPFPKARGNAAEASGKAPAKIDSKYWLPVEHHNPMELFGTTVVYEDGNLLVYDKTQGVQNVQRYLSNVLGYAPDHIRVVAPFVGGAFG